VRFKLDENVPVELRDDLRALGHEADTIPDEGIMGAPDAQVMEHVRAEGRAVLAAALHRALPVAVSGRGEIILELEATDAAYEQPITSGSIDVLAAVAALFDGATRLQVRVAPARSADQAPRRVTEESVRSERLAMLRKRDPSLDIAVDALDLELLD